MTRRYVGRALVLLILVMFMQPLLALACIALTPDGFAPPAHGDTAFFSWDERDDDEILAVVFGGDPIVTACTLLPPILEPRADVAAPDLIHVPPRVADPADHPPRLA